MQTSMFIYTDEFSFKVDSLLKLTAVQKSMAHVSAVLDIPMFGLCEDGRLASWWYNPENTVSIIDLVYREVPREMRDLKNSVLVCVGFQNISKEQHYILKQELRQFCAESYLDEYELRSTTRRYHVKREQQ